MKWVLMMVLGWLLSFYGNYSRSLSFDLNYARYQQQIQFYQTYENGLCSPDQCGPFSLMGPQPLFVPCQWNKSNGECSWEILVPPENPPSLVAGWWCLLYLVTFGSALCAYSVYRINRKLIIESFFVVWGVYLLYSVILGIILTSSIQSEYVNPVEEWVRSYRENQPQVCLISACRRSPILRSPLEVEVHFFLTPEKWPSLKLPASLWMPLSEANLYCEQVNEMACEYNQEDPQLSYSLVLHPISKEEPPQIASFSSVVQMLTFSPWLLLAISLLLIYLPRRGG